MELALAEHPDVAEVAVIAVPDELRDEEVMACVVPRPGAEPGDALARSIFDACTARLAYYKAPGWIVFVDALPVTSTRKVRKAALFAAGVDPRVGAVDLRGVKRRR